jgi:hypothetical protein
LRSKGEMAKTKQFVNLEPKQIPSYTQDWFFLKNWIGLKIESLRVWRTWSRTSLRIHHIENLVRTKTRCYFQNLEDNQGFILRNLYIKNLN